MASVSTTFGLLMVLILGAGSPLAALAQDEAVDTDGDGLSDRSELAAITDPANPDTDGDEVNDYGSYPKVADSLLDCDEIVYGSDPLVADTDGDCQSDANEVQNGTCPAVYETKEDG